VSTAIRAHARAKKLGKVAHFFVGETLADFSPIPGLHDLQYLVGVPFRDDVDETPAVCGLDRERGDKARSLQNPGVVPPDGTHRTQPGRRRCRFPPVRTSPNCLKVLVDDAHFNTTLNFSKNTFERRNVID
jgi:hypothetical protein